jgi:hypothetical protein
MPDRRLRGGFGAAALIQKSKPERVLWEKY